MKLFDRREPVRSFFLSAIILLMVAEIGLLVGGRWVLTGSDQFEATPETFSLHGESDPATPAKTICRYWTGRSYQSIEYVTDYGPRECPFMVPAQ